MSKYLHTDQNKIHEIDKTNKPEFVIVVVNGNVYFDTLCL